FGLPVWLPLDARAALDLLANPGDGVRVENVSNMGRAIVRERPIAPSEIVPEGFSIPGNANFTNPAIADLRPIRAITTLTLDINRRAMQLRTAVVGDAGVSQAAVPQSAVLVQQWDLEVQAPLRLSDAPVELRSDAPPSEPVRYVYDGEYIGLAFARTVALSEALALAATPLLVLPPGPDVTLMKIEAGQRGPNDERSDINDPFYDAVRNGVALRLTYWVRFQDSMVFYQGPADVLADFVRTHPATPDWQQSEPRRFTLAGREVTGWLLRNPDNTIKSYLVAEYDGTLIVAAASDEWLLHTGEGFLTQLEPLKR
ncbi:MAG: hypothetical protein H7Y32_12810, partial [Chloroflexales bacterium]|nr:hypothetical protein [Chloroflexales bacterium]